MAGVIIGTDGSDESVAACVAGFAVLGAHDTVTVVSVVDGIDPSLIADGGGHAGASLTPEEYDRLRAEGLAAGQDAVARTAAALGLDASQTRLLEGAPGPTLCQYAAEVGADVIVIGTRGRGGLRRAFLGSVSDHVVRNATCPVVVTGGAD